MKLKLIIAIAGTMFWGTLFYAAPSRVITTSPSLTELMYQLGAEHSLVATVDYSYYPEAAKSLPTIGSFFSPSIEKTVRFKPDYIFIDGAARNSSYEAAIQRLGISFEVFEIHSISDLYQAAQRIKEILGQKHDEPNILKFQAHKPFTFIGLVWNNPAIAFSKITFLNSLIESVGGKNLADFKGEQPYLTVSKEWLLKSNADILFFLYEFEDQKSDFIRYSREIWREKIPRIIFLPSQKFARTTFTSISALTEIEKEIHAK